MGPRLFGAGGAAVSPAGWYSPRRRGPLRPGACAAPRPRPPWPLAPRRAMTSDVGSEGRGPLCTAPGGVSAARRASSSIPVGPGHFRVSKRCSDGAERPRSCLFGPCPKRAQTKWHELSLAGSSWHETAVQMVDHCLTSPLSSSDKSEVGGSIPPSPASHRGVSAGQRPFRGCPLVTVLYR